MDLQIDDKKVALFCDETGKCHEGRIPLILLNADHGEGQDVWEQTREMTSVPFSMAAVSGMNWNDDLTPWPNPATAKWDSPYGGKADAYLRFLEDKVIPAVERKAEEQDTRLKAAWYGIAGYSLAGLFAVYALYQSERFSRAASASGSLWYPGFVDYVKSHGLKRRPDRLYLSIGDKEARTRNLYMRKVQENTELLYDWYRQQGIRTMFELNPGNHFVNDTERMARGIAWILTPDGSR